MANKIELANIKNSLFTRQELQELRNRARDLSTVFCNSSLGRAFVKLEDIADYLDAFMTRQDTIEYPTMSISEFASLPVLNEEDNREYSEDVEIKYVHISKAMKDKQAKAAVGDKVYVMEIPIDLSAKPYKCVARIFVLKD